MVKAQLKVADEIVRLLGGERGLQRLRIGNVKEFPDGISCFAQGQLVLFACIVIRKSDHGFVLSVQTLEPPIRYASYEVKPKHLKAALRLEIFRQKYR